MSMPTKPPPGNRLLAQLPASDLARLRPSLQAVALELKQVLYEPLKPLEFVYFPVRSMLSMIRVMRDGAAIEVATIGNEGMAELSPLLGERVAATRCIVQLPGAALRMRAEALRQEISRNTPLRQLLSRYQSLYLKQVYQSVACNGLHQIHQRCCRWLLLTHERCGSDAFPMTHEFLSEMLGVRQASISPVLRSLAKAGLIRNLRGKIEIIDLAGLEAHSCECFRVVKDEFDLPLE
jgi:CRP-like cAMP-binding protein